MPLKVVDSHIEARGLRPCKLVLGCDRCATAQEFCDPAGLIKQHSDAMAAGWKNRQGVEWLCPGCSGKR